MTDLDIAEDDVLIVEVPKNKFGFEAMNKQASEDEE